MSTALASKISNIVKNGEDGVIHFSDSEFTITYFDIENPNGLEGIPNGTPTPDPGGIFNNPASILPLINILLANATTTINADEISGSESFALVGIDIIPLLAFAMGVNLDEVFEITILPGVTISLTLEQILDGALTTLGVSTTLENFEINFSDTSSEDVTQEQVGGDLVFYVTDNAGVVSTKTVEGVYADDNTDEIVSVTFADGTVDLADVPAPTTVIDGTAGSDTLLGTDGDDIINGLGGNDIIEGGLGNDRLNGGSESDTLIGGEGDDTLIGEGGNDIINGDAGSDRVYAGTGNDQIFGGDGNDYIEGGGGANLIDGGDGTDAALYDNSPNRVIIDLHAGTATSGSASGDTLVSIESLTGSAFGDILTGSNVKNFLYGRDGKDSIKGLGGDDFLDGGAGDDILRGNDGNDWIVGGEGNDFLFGGAGADKLEGGDGYDTVWYKFSDAGVHVDLAAGTGSGGSAEGDSLFTSVEGISGSTYDDVLFGDSGDSGLSGLAGADILYGGAGDDRIYTGTGEDVVIFQTGDQGLTIVDFEDDVDTLDLSGMGFTSLEEALAAFTDFSDFGGGTKLIVGNDSLVLLGITAEDLADDIDLGLMVV